jgi:hypothetical protein
MSKIKVFLFSLMACLSFSSIAETKAIADTKKSEAIPQYRLELNPHDPGPDRSEVCAAFLKILNTTPFEQLYQDIFLNVLKGRGDFDTMDWQYIPDGEQRFGEVLFKQIEMDSPQPEWIAGRIDGFKKYKEEVGGFDYYLAHADVWHDGKQLPILFYINKKLQELDKRKPFDYVVMEEDLSGPHKKSYGRTRYLSPSASKQLFRYKNQTYIFDSSWNKRPYVNQIYSTLSGCTFDRIHKEK